MGHCWALLLAPCGPHMHAVLGGPSEPGALHSVHCTPGSLTPATALRRWAGSWQLAVGSWQLPATKRLLEPGSVALWSCPSFFLARVHARSTENLPFSPFLSLSLFSLSLSLSQIQTPPRPPPPPPPPHQELIPLPLPRSPPPPPPPTAHRTPHTPRRTPHTPPHSALRTPHSATQPPQPPLPTAPPRALTH